MIWRTSKIVSNAFIITRKKKSLKAILKWEMKDSEQIKI